MIEITLRRLYAIGAICFGIGAAMGVLNQFIMPMIPSVRISSIASLVFSIVITLFFWQQYRETSNVPESTAEEITKAFGEGKTK